MVLLVILLIFIIAIIPIGIVGAGDKYRVTGLGNAFLQFIKNEDLWPNKPADVDQMHKLTRMVWDKIKDDPEFVEIISGTESKEETYGLGNMISYYVNYMLSLNNEPPYWYEPRKLKVTQQQKIIDRLSTIGFIE